MAAGQAHLSRALWGPDARQFLHQVDELLVDTFIGIMGLPQLTAWQRRLCQEPINDGGCGLPSIAALHAAAHIGAFAGLPPSTDRWLHSQPLPHP